MLSKFIHDPDFRNSTGEILSYWWIFGVVFLSSWFLLAITSSNSEQAFGWAVLSAMFFGLPLVAAIVIFKRVKTGGAPNADTYWQNKKLSKSELEKWNKKLSKGRRSNSQIDEILKNYR